MEAPAKESRLSIQRDQEARPFITTRTIPSHQKLQYGLVEDFVVFEALANEEIAEDLVERSAFGLVSKPKTVDVRKIA